MGPSMHWKRSVFVSGWVGEWGSGWVMKIEVSPRRRLMRNRGGQSVVAGGKSEISSFPFSASPFPFSDPQALCKEAGRQPTWGWGGCEEDGVRAQMVPWTPSTLSSHLNMAATALHSTHVFCLFCCKDSFFQDTIMMCGVWRQWSRTKAKYRPHLQQLRHLSECCSSLSTNLCSQIVDHHLPSAADDPAVQGGGTNQELRRRPKPKQWQWPASQCSGWSHRIKWNSATLNPKH